MDAILQKLMGITIVIFMVGNLLEVGLRLNVADALTALRNSGVADEAVILSTCNRVEIYAASQLEAAQAFAGMREFLLSTHGYREPLTDELYSYAEPQSFCHLFKVASGLDSMVLGETEILGELKKAYELALQGGHTGPRLNKAFQRALGWSLVFSYQCQIILILG